MNVYINDIAKFLPGPAVSNDEMEEYLGLIGGKKSKAKNIVLKSNGIKSRHYVLEKGTQKALFSNAQITANAIKNLNFDLQNLEVLSCGTTSPDVLMPNHTLMTLGILGISQIETSSSSGICVSGMNALKYAYMSVKSGNSQNAISTASEISSCILQAKNFKKESQIIGLKQNAHLAFEKDFLRWMLSDGAGAILVENKPNKDKISFQIEFIDIISYAGIMPVCMYSGCKIENEEIRGFRTYDQEEIMANSLLGVSQNVKLLNENIIDYTICKPLEKIRKKYNICASDIDYFLPHYSSEYFRDKVYEGLKSIDFEIPYEKWFTNLTRYGNTGSASMYIILEEFMCKKELKNGDKILCYIPESGRFSTSFMLLKVVL